MEVMWHGNHRRAYCMARRLKIEIEILDDATIPDGTAFIQGLGIIMTNVVQVLVKDSHRVNLSKETGYYVTNVKWKWER
jgi:hypothetical protein